MLVKRLKSLISSYQCIFFTKSLDGFNQIENITIYNGAVFSEITDFSSEIFSQNSRKDRYLKHIKSGYKCFGFIDNVGRVISYCWVALGSKAPWYKGLILDLSEKESYIFDCRTDEGRRGKGFYPACLKNICHILKKENFEKAYIDCEAGNTPSLRGILSAGFSESKKFKVIKLFSAMLVCRGMSLHIVHSNSLTSDSFAAN